MVSLGIPVTAPLNLILTGYKEKHHIADMKQEKPLEV
jgi:hypothetical protein